MSFYSLILGALSGLVASSTLQLSNRALFSPAFGPFPAMCGLLLGAGIGFLLNRNSTFSRVFKQGTQRPWWPLIICLILYTGVFSLPIQTTFISQEATALNFILFTCFYLATGGIQLAILLLIPSQVMLPGDTASRLHTPSYLAATAVLIALRSLIPESMDAFHVQDVAFLLVLFSGYLIHRRSIVKPKSGKGNAKASQASSQKDRPPESTMESILAGIVITAFVFFQCFVRRQLAELSLSTETFDRFFLPASLFLFAIGLSTSRLFKQNVASVRFLALAGLSITISLAMYAYASSLFPSLYVAYFQGNSLATLFAEIVLLFSALPSLLAGIVLTPSFPSESATGQARRSTVIVIASAVLGIMLFAIIEAYLSLFVSSVILSSALALGLVFPIIAGGKRSMTKIVSVLIGCFAIVLLFMTKQKGYDTLTDPNRFIIRAEQRMPGGLLSLFQSRDYDDPFQAVTWNHTMALTQGSRSVHNALYKLGHIPMFVHPAPESVLLLGWGSGLPAEAMKMHAPRRFVCVEPTDGITFLIDSLARRLHEPSPTRGVEFHCERMSSYLSHTADKFDVIISAEPFSTPRPMNSGFTKEYYSAIARHLNEKGILAQSLPLARIRKDDFAAVLGSIDAVFEHTQLWVTSADQQTAMACILASNAAIPSLNTGRERFETMMRNDVVAFHFKTNMMRTWADVVSNYALDEAGLQRVFGHPAPLRNAAPLIVAEEDADRFTTPIPAIFAALSLQSGRFDGLPDSVKGIATAINEERAKILRASSMATAGDDTTATKILLEVLQKQPFNTEAQGTLAELLLRRSMIFISQQNYQASIPLLNEVMKLIPLNSLVLRQLMIASMRTGDKITAGMSIDALRRIAPRHAGFRDNQASIRGQMGQIEDALLLYENAITLDPLNENFYVNMAALQVSLGHIWEAIRILDNGGEKAYYPAKAFYFKGRLYAERNRTDLARKAFEGYFGCATPDDQFRADAEETLKSLTSPSR